MKEQKRKLELDRAVRRIFCKLVYTKDLSVLSPLLFAMVIDELTENAR